MATQLNIVNDLQRRLRETVTASVSTNSYSQLLAMFVNDAKEYMEDQWFWTVNETAIDTTILGDSSTRQYDLTETTDRSFLIRRTEDRLPMAFDLTDSEEGQLWDIPLNELRIWRDTFPGTPDCSDKPVRFAIYPDSDGRGYSIELDQCSTSQRDWRTYWYAPQAELALDGTDDSTEILLPKRPIFLLALYYALNERGEEMGEPGNVAEQRAMNAVAAAMELDMQVHKTSDAKDMTNLESLRNKVLGDL